MTDPTPEGYTTVTPWLISPDTAALIDYVTRAFDAEELFRFTTDEGRIGHAEVRIGDAIAMMFDAAPGWPRTPGTCACTSRMHMPCTARRSPPAALR